MRLLHITTSQPTRRSIGSSPLWPRGWLGASLHQDRGPYHISLAQEKIQIQNMVSIECILLSHHYKVKKKNCKLNHFKSEAIRTPLVPGSHLSLCRPHICSCIQSPEQICVNPLRTQTPAHSCSDPSMLTSASLAVRAPKSQQHMRAPTLRIRCCKADPQATPTRQNHTVLALQNVQEFQRDILPWT